MKITIKQLKEIIKESIQEINSKKLQEARVGYSGNVTFDTSILRYEYPDGNITTDQQNEIQQEVEIILTVSGEAYYKPGKYSGAYEDSYPDESDVEILELTNKQTGEDYLPLITPEEKSEIENEIVEMVKDKFSSDAEDAAYERYRAKRDELW